MAIRDLESFWPRSGPDVRFLCNRGVNGIDGFLSSGLGAAATSAGPVVIVTGDLGFYHDLNGLLAAKRYGLRAVIIVLNNDGGGIFSYLPQAYCGSAFDEYFVTSHGLEFRAAAEMYGCEFHRAASWPDFRSALDGGLRSAGTTVVEVPVNRERSVALHRAVWEVAARATAEMD
jgi:2-succinyl-5-enolpyruvyl-6-hydroxy-3-cyclohexene-1-carboxylate synthase